MDRRYSVFVIYADEDEPFVKDFLVPALDLDPGRVLLCREFTPGASLVAEIERGVTTSGVTLAVLSPAYLRDRWARFTDELAGYASGTTARLIPLLLDECTIPLPLRFRVMLDFRNKAKWHERAADLREFLVAAPSRVDASIPSASAGYFGGRETKNDVSAHARSGKERSLVAPRGCARCRTRRPRARGVGRPRGPSRAPR